MKKMSTKMLGILAVGFFAAAAWLQLHAAPVEGAADTIRHIVLWEPLTSDRYSSWEKFALLSCLAISLIGLLYALMLVRQVRKADKGTPKMQEIALAIREGADAYLFRQ